VSAGSSHSLALKTDGTIWAWGSNFNGQLGDGTTTQRESPVQIQLSGKVLLVGAGNNVSIAIVEK
jgi:alpha-tubulin suppressor-like RCC1 family protein